jgi:hypothetical protein
LEECNFKSDVTCNNCHKTGHIAKICRKPKSDEAKQKASDQAPVKSACVVDIVEIASVDVVVDSIDTTKLEDLRPHLKCTLAGVLMDTGADCALISQELFDKFKEYSECIVEKVKPVNIRTADGQKGLSDKVIIIPVAAGPNQAKIRFRVYPRLQKPCLLGVDALHMLNARMYFPAQHTATDEQLHLPDVHCCVTSLEQWLEVQPIEVEGEKITSQNEPAELRLDLPSNPVIATLEREIPSGKPSTEPLTMTEIHERIDKTLEAIKQLGPITIAPGYTIHTVYS